jgi:lipid-A-disaccharide synthase
MRVMISCGEPSGDLYAGALAREILQLAPGATITGFGGDRLAAAGATLVENFSGLSVTGLIEVVRLLPRTYATYKRLLAEADAIRPDVFVAIDFPDFNFRLANALKKRGIPVVYYISPQLWAWRAGRMKTMKRVVDRVLVIFAFEEAIYREAGVPVEWVGHPLLDVQPPARSRESFLAEQGLNPSSPLLALLPGSRTNELREILPRLSAAAQRIREQVPDGQFILARAPHLRDELFEPLRELERTGARVVTVEGSSDAVLASADAAIVASGTVTVQGALHECPMVVVYRLSPLTYKVGKPFVRVDTYAMVNLVAGRRVVAELIQDDFTPDAVALEARRLLTDKSYAHRMRVDLHDVREKLGAPGASRRAAQAILRAARTQRT